MSTVEARPYTLRQFADVLETSGSLVLKQRLKRADPAGDKTAATAESAKETEPVVYVNIAGHVGPIYFSLGQLGPDTTAPGKEPYKPPFLGAVPSKHKLALSDDTVSAFVCIPDPEDIANLKRINTWIRTKVVELNKEDGGKKAFMKKKNGTAVSDLDEYDLWKDPFNMPDPTDDKKSNATLGVKWAVGRTVRDSLKTEFRTFTRNEETRGIVISARPKDFNVSEWQKSTRVYQIVNFSSIAFAKTWGITFYARKVLCEATAGKPQGVAWDFGDGVSVTMEDPATHARHEEEGGSPIAGAGSGSAGGGSGGGPSAASFDPTLSAAHAEDAAATAARIEAETKLWMETVMQAQQTLVVDEEEEEEE